MTEGGGKQETVRWKEINPSRLESLKEVWHQSHRGESLRGGPNGA